MQEKLKYTSSEYRPIITGLLHKFILTRESTVKIKLNCVPIYFHFCLVPFLKSSFCSKHFLLSMSVLFEISVEALNLHRRWLCMWWSAISCHLSSLHMIFSLLINSPFICTCTAGYYFAFPLLSLPTFHLYLYYACVLSHFQWVDFGHKPPHTSMMQNFVDKKKRISLLK